MINITLEKVITPQSGKPDIVDYRLVFDEIVEPYEWNRLVTLDANEKNYFALTNLLNKTNKLAYCLFNAVQLDQAEGDAGILTWDDLVNAYVLTHDESSTPDGTGLGNAFCLDNDFYENGIVMVNEVEVTVPDHKKYIEWVEN